MIAELLRTILNSGRSLYNTGALDNCVLLSLKLYSDAGRTHAVFLYVSLLHFAMFLTAILFELRKVSG